MSDAASVEKHRESRKLSELQFATMMDEEGVVVLDPRGRSFHEACHVEGSVNLPFTHFDPDSVAAVIPSKDTKVLIYCRNNLSEEFLENKGPVRVFEYPEGFEPPEVPKGISSALTIPSYITLYQYGYRNVWELSDIVNPETSKIRFVKN